MLVSEIRYILDGVDTYHNMQTAARNFTDGKAADRLAGILTEIAIFHE